MESQLKKEEAEVEKDKVIVKEEILQPATESEVDDPFLEVGDVKVEITESKGDFFSRLVLL